MYHIHLNLCSDITHDNIILRNFIVFVELGYLFSYNENIFLQ